MPPNGAARRIGRSRQRMSGEAPYIDEYQYVCEFDKLLKEHRKWLRLANYGEIPQDCVVVWSKLVCKKCRLHFESSRQFLEHILHCQFTEEDVFGYRKYGLISDEIQQVITDAQADRADNSIVAKTIVNQDELKLIAPLNSPLASYLVRGLTVHIGKWPQDLKRAVYTYVRKGRKKYFLFFSGKGLARQYEEIERKKEERKKKKNFKLLKRTLQPFQLSMPDIVLNPESRTPETTRLLEESLSLPENSSQETIVEEVMKQFKRKSRTRSNSTSPFSSSVLTTINGDGQDISEMVVKPSLPQKLKSAKLKLQSDFTTDFLTPLQPKRKPVTPSKQ